jgi:6-phosphogluconolactonase
MEPIIEIFPSLAELTAYFSSRVAENLATKKPGQYLSIALSGGSTPKSIFRIIADKHRPMIDWSRIVLFWGDERCVPHSDPESNYRMTYENLFRHLNFPKLNFCRIDGENVPEEEAKRYSERVDIMLPHANGLPQFDMMMLGLGDDGHTASIFPYNIGLFGSENLFETSVHPVTGQKRITATGKLINNSREICFLVTGTEKAHIVATVLLKKEGWEKLPASLVHPADGRVIWLLDRKAAALL